MKIEVDSQKCVAAGLCVLTEDSVFDQDPATGTVVLLTERPEPDAASSAREAAHICPAMAISIHEDEV